MSKFGNEDQNCWVDLSNCYSKEDLPTESEEMVAPDKVRNWNHLHGIATKIPN